MSFRLHAKINFFLNLINALYLPATLFFSYFTITTGNSALSVGLTTVSFPSQYPGLENLETFTRISNIISTCRSDSSTAFQDICLILPGLKAGGLLYIILLPLVELCVLNSITGLLWVYFQKGNAKLEFTALLSPIFFMLTLIGYYLISKGNAQHSQIFEASGIGYCLLLLTLLLLTSLHYYIVLKRRYPEEFDVPNDSLIQIQNIDRSLTPSRVAADTFQSDEDLVIASRLRRRTAFTSQSVQVEEAPIDQELKANLSSDILELVEEKVRLERLIEDCNPDVSVYQSSLEIKNKEIFTLKENIAEMKSALAGMDLRYRELEVDLDAERMKVESLSLNNKILCRNLDERDRMIENLRGSSNFRSFEEVSEKDTKREGQSSNDRFTDSTNIGGSLQQSDRESVHERINYLSKALEAQMDLNEKLHVKNKSLEDSNFKLEDSLLRMKGKSQSTDSKVKSKSFKPFIEEVEVGDLEKQFKEQRAQIFSLKEKKQNYKTIIQIQLTKIKETSEDRDRLFGDFAKIKEALKESIDECENLKFRHAKQRNDWEIEKNDLNYTSVMLARELDTLKFRLRAQEESMNSELMQANSEIERMQDQLKYYIKECELAKSESARLKEVQELLTAQLAEKSNESECLKLSSDKLSHLVSLDLNVEKSITELDKNFHEVLNEKDELRKSLALKDSEIIELSEINQKLSQKLYELQGSQSITPKSEHSNKNDTYSSLQSESSGGNSVMSVQELMIIESLTEINPRKNPLLEVASKLRKEPPMIYSNLWKLMEMLMEEKAKVDRLDLALKRSPRSMTDFTQDFLLLHFGLQSLANKQLKALLTSLEELHRLNHPYGVFFCRLLGLYHPRPLSKPLSTYLILIQHLFNTLSPSSKSRNFAQHYEILQYGGQCSIVDVMELIMRLCKTHREIGERLIYSIHRDSDRKLDIAMLKVCGTMARTGKNARSFFELLDINHTNGLDYHELVDGIRLTLGIWVTQEEAEDICAYIDSDSNGLITQEEWSQKMDLDEYSRRSGAGEAMVTKVQVLNAFIEEFELEMIEDYNRVRQEIKCKSLDLKEFERFVRKIDKEVKEHEVVRMFEELKEIERTNSVSPEGACVSVVKNKLGGYGVGIFGKHYVDLDQISLIS